MHGNHFNPVGISSKRHTKCDISISCVCCNCQKSEIFYIIKLLFIVTLQDMHLVH